MAVVVLMSVPVLAKGLNVNGVSGGYLNPDATVSQRLTVSTSFIDLNSLTTTNLSVAGTVLKRVELGVTRINMDSSKANIYNAKVAIGKVNIVKDKLSLALAGGVNMLVFDGKINHGANVTNYYAVVDTTVLKSLRLSAGANENDATGKWKTLGFASLGADLKVFGLSVGAEFVQEPKDSTNQTDAFLAKTVNGSTIKVGMANLTKGNNSQVFASLSSEL